MRYATPEQIVHHVQNWTDAICRTSAIGRSIGDTMPDNENQKPMSRSEQALFNKGVKYIHSPSFLKKARKVMEHYGAEPILPDMLPVEISKRLKRCDGLCHYARKVQISYDHWKYSKDKGYDVLKHEIIHHFYYTNRNRVVKEEWSWKYKEQKQREFEKNCFVVFGFTGEHNSWRWKYTGSCGCWQKRSNKTHIFRCRHGTLHISRAEYRKLERVAKVKSKIFPVEIEKYSIFEEERLSPF